MGESVDDTFEAAAADNLELKLTLSEESDLMLERDLQDEACRGICQDIIIEQLVSDDSSSQDHTTSCSEINHYYSSSPPSATTTGTTTTPKRWPLVVVDREDHNNNIVKPEGIVPVPSTTSNGRKRSFLFTKSARSSSTTPSTTEPLAVQNNVDLVFVDQDKDTVLGIEVCSSPSDKITDLQELQQRGALFC